MNKAIFLDRDGTINIDKDYLYKIEDFEFISGAITALKMLYDAGYYLFIMTNQSGIARGYYTEEDFNKLNNWMLAELARHGIEIKQVYYCPHLPDAKVKKYSKACDCRKPSLGMFNNAIKKYNIDLSQSFAIGDKLSDCALCFDTECKGFLVGNKEGKDLISEVRSGKYGNIKYQHSLFDSVLQIIA